MLKAKYIAAIAATGVALAGSISFTSGANAFETVAKSYAIVGSDTLEDVVGAMVNGSNGGIQTTTSLSQTLGNFDATGGATGSGSFIITKSGRNMIPRPNGSKDGRRALVAAILGYQWNSGALSTAQTVGSVVAGNIDIVRSSSDGSSVSSNAADATSLMQRFFFGRDAIAYAYGSALTSNTVNTVTYDPASIPASDLAKLYACDTTTLTNYGIDQVVIPQFGSGTRADFLTMLNANSGGTAVSDTTMDALLDSSSLKSTSTPSSPIYGAGGAGHCIHVGQEHDASALGTHAIMPMSASRWIAMKNGQSPLRIATGAQLGSPVSITGSTFAYDGTGTTKVASTVTSGSTLLPNVDYYKSAFGRDTYLFASRTRIANEPVLAALFDPTNQTSLTYQGYTPDATVSAAVSKANAANYTRLSNVTSAATLFADPATAGTTLLVKLKFGFLPALGDPTINYYCTTS